MDNREKEIQKLCEQVLSATVDFWDNPNGAYENTCPFCGALEERGGKNAYAGMDELKHESSCGYLIAKDLSTNLKNMDV